MKNMGIFDPNWNPIMPGGLTEHDVGHLKRLGWLEGTTEVDAPDVPIAFSAPELPGRVTMHNFSVPKGTRYLYNPKDERAVLLDCANATCWRYLVRAMQK